MGEAGDVTCRAAESSLLHHLPCGGDHMCCVVPVRADRTHRRGDAERGAGVALLDEADSCCHRLHRGTRLHVRPVQDVRAAVPQMEGLQQDHLRTERTRERWHGAAAAATSGELAISLLLKY